MSIAEYDDVSKPVADFFSKPFPSKNSVKFSSETNLDGVVNSTRTVKPGDKGFDIETFETTVEPKYECKASGLSAELKLQTSNVLSATLSKSGLVQGLKLSLNGIQEFPDNGDVEQTINLGVEFKNEKVFFKATGGYPLEARSFPIKGSLVAQPVDNVFVGTKFNFGYNPSEKGFAAKEVDFKIAGSSGATKGHVTGNLARKIGLGVNHALNADDTVGVQINASFPAEKPAEEGKVAKKPVNTLSIDLAGQRKDDDYEL